MLLIGVSTRVCQPSVQSIRISGSERSMIRLKTPELVRREEYPSASNIECESKQQWTHGLVSGRLTRVHRFARPLKWARNAHMRSTSAGRSPLLCPELQRTLRHSESEGVVHHGHASCALHESEVPLYLGTLKDITAVWSELIVDACRM